jgi:hypothetical protein
MFFPVSNLLSQFSDLIHVRREGPMKVPQRYRMLTQTKNNSLLEGGLCQRIVLLMSSANHVITIIVILGYTIQE